MRGVLGIMPGIVEGPFEVYNLDFIVISVN